MVDHYNNKEWALSWCLAGVFIRPVGGLSASPFSDVVMKVTARSCPAKGWPCLMKTDEAEIKCLPTLRDSFITVRPRAIEHLGMERCCIGPLSSSAPCRQEQRRSISPLPFVFIFKGEVLLTFDVCTHTNP